MLGSYSSVAFLKTGSVVDIANGATVEVRRQSDNVVADIFEDRAGGSALANPFLTNSLGEFEFYAAGINQGYKITITKGASVQVKNNQQVGLMQDMDFVYQYLKVDIGGQAIDEEIIFSGFFFPERVTIDGVGIFAREAPVGAALLIDFLRDDLEEGLTITLADGSKDQSTAVDVNYTAAQEFGVKVKQVGSTTPGAEIGILIRYKNNPLT